VLVGALSLVLAAPAAASDYCVPQNTHYDPKDVPAGGAELLTPPGVTRTTVTVDGITTPVLATGPQASREAVVFLHGSPGSAQGWLDLLPRAGTLGRRAVAWDLPGYGHATKPWNPDLTIQAAGRFVGDMLARLGITRAHLVLHDVGGAGGLQWAAEHPRSLVSAVMIDSGLLGYRHHSFAQLLRTPEAGEGFMAALNRSAWSSGMQMGQEERPLPQSFVDQVYDDLDRPTRCTMIGVYRSAEEDRIEAAGRAQAAVLSKRRRPALILWGGRDPYTPPEMAARQREAFPGAQIEIFDDSGHWPFVDDAPRAAGLIVPFVRCLPTGKRDRIGLALSTRHVRAGTATEMRLEASVRREGRRRPVCGARVRLAGQRATTDNAGIAHFPIAPARPGLLRAKAAKAGLRPASVPVRAR
jgi:pimeloyl-ACP methyl ester carboxylesterase